MGKDKEKPQKQLTGILREMSTDPGLVEKFNKIEEQLIKSIDTADDYIMSVIKTRLASGEISIPDASKIHLEDERLKSETFNIPIAIARLLRMEDDINGWLAGFLNNDTGFVETWLDGEWPSWIERPNG